MMKTLFLAAAIVSFQATAALAPASASIVVAPTELDPGSTISPLPNGFSSGDGIPSTLLFDQSENFSFAGGLAGTLRDRVIHFSDTPSLLHPGLYFDYEIQLTSGSVAAFSIFGYSTVDTFVKVCGISGCGGSGANGLAPTSASRSSSGDEISFDFGDILTAGQHSANLQIFSSATLFQDPLAFFTDGNGDTFSINVVGPASHIPEPPAWPMILLGFLGVCFVAHRGKQNKGRGVHALQPGAS